MYIYLDLNREFGIILVLSWYPLNCDVTFESTNRLKVNNNNFKFNSDFKSYITVVMTLRKH